MEFAYIFLKIFWWSSDKKTRWEMLPFDGRLIWDHFVYFSLYHGNGSLFFFVKLWIGFVAINLTITKNTIHTAFTLPDHFWAFWAQFLVHIPLRLEKPKLFSWCVAQNILVLLWWPVIKKILICFSHWLGNFLVIFYHFGVCSSSSRDPFNIYFKFCVIFLFKKLSNISSHKWSWEHCNESILLYVYVNNIFICMQIHLYLSVHLLIFKVSIMSSTGGFIKVFRWTLV